MPGIKIQKVILLIINILLINVYAFGQIEENYKPSNLDRLVYGGYIGLQFGTTTFIDLSPSVGYKVTPKFIPGIGLTYQYFQDKSYTPDYSTNVIGGRAFMDYYIFENLFAHIEYEYVTYEAYLLYSNNKEWVNVSSYLIGGGYMQRISPGVGFGITVLYNLNETDYSLYSNPIIRLGITAGL